jgi:hypothetical protein
MHIYTHIPTHVYLYVWSILIKIEEGYESEKDNFGLCHLLSVDDFSLLVFMEGAISYSI